MTATTPNIRFQQARERLRLSEEEAAALCGISPACLRDIEGHADELTSCYSASDVLRFSRALQVRAPDFFGADVAYAPISVRELSSLIHDECRRRSMKLEEFEDSVGWKLSDSIEPPERLLSDLTLDGLQWLCRELHVDWLRVIAAREKEEPNQASEPMPLKRHGSP